MKTKTLLKALKTAAPALHHRDFVPVLTHFCFADDRVFAYDDKTAVIVFEETGLRCAVPGRTLLQVLDGAGDEVEVRQENSEVVLKDKGSTIRLPILPEASFVFDVPDIDADLEIPMTEELVEALEFVATCASKESLKPELLGVTLLLQKGKPLILYASDNITCTKITMSGKLKMDRIAVIPRSSAELIGKVYRDLSETLESASLLISDHYVLATYADKDSKQPVCVVSKVLPIEPADVESIIRKHTKNITTFDIPSELEQAVQRCIIVTSQELTQRCILQGIGKDKISASAKGSLGQADTVLSAKGAPTSEPLTLNPLYLLRALPHCKKMSLQGTVVTLHGEENWKVDQIVSVVQE